MVLPRFVSAALAGEPLSVFGDGEQTRAFCHIQDVIQGLLVVIDSTKAIGQVFNIGNGSEISIKDLAERIIEVTKSKSKLEYKPYVEAYGAGFEDLERRFPDISKIERELGWRPNRDLEEIIVDVANFMRNS